MKKKLVWILVSVILVLAIIWMLWANTALELNVIHVSSSRLPESFRGFSIAHVSDLHSAQMGDDNEKLLALLRQAKPDIIAITGDLMDFRDEDPSVALHFAQEAVKIAPVYYVTGNHEARLPSELYDELIVGLQTAGVTVLMDSQVILTRDGASISICGHKWGDTDMIGNISDFDGFRVLLSHHPEDFLQYCKAGYDLVLTGHAHGGQVRLPFVGGLYAPGQGLFPKYDSGLYSEGNTAMIVSRGIGNSTFPLRVNNRPEVILVVLEG